MKRKFFLEKLHNEKGVAAVLVLAVILVLTTLGTIALMTSAANISMSSKSKQWTTQYYSLDSQAEEYVEMVDNELRSAELSARQYVQNEYCKREWDSPEFAAIASSAGLDIDFQKIINNGYKATWYTPTNEFKSIEYYINTSPSAIENDIRLEYQNDVKKFESELFNRVYFYYASKKLNALIDKIPKVPNKTALVLKNAGIPNAPGVSASTPCTDKFTIYDPHTKDWTAYAPQNDDLVLYIYVDNEAENPTDVKKVEVSISVTIPKYEAVLQYTEIPFNGNPIWANAIAAQGGIKVDRNSTAAVEGDIFASDGGVQCVTDAAIRVNGNIYTAGDVHVSGDRGEISVYRSAAPIEYTAKKKIYDNWDGDVYLSFRPDIALANLLGDYTEGTSTADSIPFVFNDYSNWGNVYCKNLSVDESVLTGSSIDIQGNLVVESDIQMDGQHSKMVIGSSSGAVATNCIGLKSDSSEQDPNESSSIINNYPFENDGVTRNSSITINSALFVPGVAFYEFDQGGPDWSQVNGKYYYKSAESISSRVTSPTAIFDAYYATGSNFISPPFQRNGDKYYLTTPSGIEMISGLKDFITSAGGVKTNIIGSSPATGSYVLGAALMQRSDSEKATVYTGINFGHSYDHYSSLKNSHALMDIFYAKTQGLGVSSSAVQFNQYVNKSYNASTNGFIFYNGDSELPISGKMGGIVYCEGDLTITGDGEFKGSIICEGKLTIKGKPKIIYDEGVIITKLRNNPGIRAFFDTTTGSIGQVIDHATEYSTTSGTRKQVKRYLVRSWKELQK